MVDRNKHSRRRYLKLAGGSASLATLTGSAGCLGSGNGNGDSDTIKMGVLEDRSGEFALTGIQKYHAQTLAVEEINEDGGILGQEIEMIDPDPQSDVDRYRDLSRQLINEDQVDVLFAGFASSTREAVRPIANQNQQLYIYTNQYEGGVCDSYTFCTGAVPEQQISPVLPELVDEFGPDIYTIAADYNFGQITAAWYRTVADEIGANIVEEEFIPLGVGEFGSTINNIQEADPDILVTLLVGNAQAGFYDQKRAAGLDIPMSTTVNMAQGYEHRRFDPPSLANMYVGVNYMEEIDTDRNNSFVDRYYERWGDEAEYLGQMAQNSYFSTYLYKAAVEEAGTTDQDAVIEALESEISIEAPEGDIRMDPETHHMSHIIRLARADEDHNIEFVDNLGEIDPFWLSEGPGCNLLEESDSSQYEPI